MDFQPDTQKNQKTGLFPMKLYLMDMDEATKHESSRIQSHPASPSWPFRMPVIGMSGSGKTNILGNLFLGTKAECICKASHELSQLASFQAEPSRAEPSQG